MLRQFCVWNHFVPSSGSPARDPNCDPPVRDDTKMEENQFILLLSEFIISLYGFKKLHSAVVMMW